MPSLVPGPKPLMTGETYFVGEFLQLSINFEQKNLTYTEFDCI